MATLTFDEALTQVGEFGVYQLVTCGMLNLVGIATALHSMTYVFWAARVDHHCKLPKDFTNRFPNLSINTLNNYTIPWDDKTSKLSQCLIYDRDYQNVTEEEILRSVYYESMESKISTKKCDVWDYDTSQYESTVISQWNLVCDKAWMASAVQATYYAGKMLGGLIGGTISDRFGRRPITVVTAYSQVVFSILLAFMPNVYLFLIVRFLLSAVTEALYTSCAYVIMMEIVGAKWRDIVSNMFMTFWAIGYLLIAGMAYGIRNHFHLLLAASIPMVIFFLYGFIQESPRWYFAHGKTKEGYRVLRKIAKINKKIIPEDFEIVLPKEERATESRMKTAFKCLLKSRIMIKRGLIMMFLWVSNNIVYYGISLNTSNLGGNDYLNFAIAGGVEIPAYIACWLIIKYLGRKLPLFSIMLLCGISLICIALLPSDEVTLKICLAMFGKFAITASFSIIYILCMEIFPTVMCAFAIGTCNTMGYFVGIFVPYITDLAIYNPILPVLLMGSVALIAAALTLFLPETRNSTLPKTVEEAENIGSNFGFFGCKSKNNEEKKIEVNNCDQNEEATSLSPKSPNLQI